MIRQFDQCFILDTEGTTYAFRVLPSGHLEHLYYGSRIPLDAASAAALSEPHAFVPGNTIAYSPDHPALALEDTCLELSFPGKGDLREPFVEVVHADGSRTSDFLFAGAEISSAKPPLATLPSAYTEGEAEHLCLTLKDAVYPVTLELRYDVYPDCDCICRSAVLRNTGDAPLALERLLSLQLDLPDAGWCVTSFHGAWAREMEKHTTPLTAGKYVVESRAGSSSNRANPFVMLHAPDATETAGDCYGCNLIYSGNHYTAAEVNAYGKTRLASGINPTGFRFLLGPGERFEAPEAVLTYSSQGFAGQSRNMHRFVRRHILRGVWKERPRPVLLNSWEASYFDFSESSLVSLAKTGRDLGIELFVMDDGWFGERSNDTKALGDWDPNPKKLPGGLAGLCKKINGLGMDFGLWVEPEMVNTDSALYRAHPDWAMSIPGAPHAEGRNQRILDLSNPAVVDWLIEKMSAVFSAAPIAYVKWDYNRVFSDVYSPALPPERQGEAAHRYICGLYRLMGALVERFPNILFEGCASGGGRFDLGILSYFPQIWASDNTDAISRAAIQEGYSYAYPQCTVSAHVSASPNHQTLRETPLDTRFAVAAFGVLGYELDLRDLSSGEREEIKAQIALYKQWREVLQYGRFYRGRTGNLHEWTCVAPDRSAAVGMLLQELVRPNTSAARFFAKGLDREARYHFRNLPRSINVKRFGSLINTQTPVHVRTDSLVHNVIAKVMKMPGETEDVTVPGGVLMAGLPLRPGFAGTGFGENVRLFQDFDARLYLMEREGE